MSTSSSCFAAKLALVVLCSGTLMCPASASLVSIPVTVDARASSPDNFASISETVQNPPELNVSLFGAFETRAALEFDLGALPPPGDIVSASLVLYFEESNDIVGVHGAAGDGAITDSDFQFNNPIATLDPTSGFPAVENVVDVTSYIQSVAGVNAGAVFQLRELFDNESNLIVGSGSSSTNFHPRLDVTVIPEPASAAMLAFGGLALVTRRRQRKRSPVHLDE